MTEKLHLIGVRISLEEEEKLNLLCRATMRTRSEVVRRLLQGATLGEPPIIAPTLEPAPDHAA